MEEFVTFEIAKKLKEKGFNYPCIAHYDINKKLRVVIREPIFWHSDVLSYIDAPTISQVLKWLRVEKNIICLPHIDPFEEKWFFYVVKLPQATDIPEYFSTPIYNTYEEAALAGIEYVLDKLI